MSEVSISIYIYIYMIYFHEGVILRFGILFQMHISAESIHLKLLTNIEIEMEICPISFRALTWVPQTLVFRRFLFLAAHHLRFTINISNPINPDTNSFRDFVHFLGSTRTWSFPLSTYRSNEFGLPNITCCFVASSFKFQADCQFSILYSSPVIVFNTIGLLILKTHPSKAVGWMLEHLCLNLSIW